MGLQNCDAEPGRIAMPQAPEVINTKATDLNRAARTLRAAQYVRMSTDHQCYSPANQPDANENYATERGIEIVITYYDPGISGLHIKGRDALKQLIEDVQSKDRLFDVVLVYDISRWGRFQDIDESAYYEYICRRAGVFVCYCAEPFENDGSPLAAIAKGIKRLAAAEYSRELSIKVFNAQRRLVELGYHQGGQVGYGLRRLLLSDKGIPKGELKPGEIKNIFTDRVLVIPGPLQEVAVVRWVFDSFVRRGKGETEIAKNLNKRNIKSLNDRIWTGEKIHRVLVNERYVGNNVWNRSSVKLKGIRVENEPDKWVRADGAFQAIVSRAQFDAAQVKIRERLRERSKDEKLAPLRRLFKEHGYLSVELIHKTPGVPVASTYARWFGSLPNVYKLVGFNERSKLWPQNITLSNRRLTPAEMLEMLRQVWKKHGYLTLNLIDRCHDIPCASSYQRYFGKVSTAYELIGYTNTAPRSWRPRNAKTITRHLSDEEMLQKLRQLLHLHGHLQRTIIDEDDSTPSASAYKNRFGSLDQAYKRIGFTPGARTFSSPRETKQRRTNHELLEGLNRLLRKHGRLSRDIINSGETAGTNAYVRRFGSLTEAYKLIGYTPNFLHGKRAGGSV
jgi:DNA invertase Pin-like site-specific DNA recombinase/NADH:ubiquinone oxidoreductase subunit E